MFRVLKSRNILLEVSGDKTTLVLGPLAAASGVAMPMMNGDDEEHLTSTTEKLKAIPKVNTEIDLDDFTDQVQKTWLCLC